MNTKKYVKITFKQGKKKKKKDFFKKYDILEQNFILKITEILKKILPQNTLTMFSSLNIKI